MSWATQRATSQMAPEDRDSTHFRAPRILKSSVSFCVDPSSWYQRQKGFSEQQLGSWHPAGIHGVPIPCYATGALLGFASQSSCSADILATSAKDIFSASTWTAIPLVNPTCEETVKRRKWTPKAESLQSSPEKIHLLVVGGTVLLGSLFHETIVAGSLIRQLLSKRWLPCESVESVESPQQFSAFLPIAAKIKHDKPVRQISYHPFAEQYLSGTWAIDNLVTRGSCFRCPNKMRDEIDTKNIQKANQFRWELTDPQIHWLVQAGTARPNVCPPKNKAATVDKVHLVDPFSACGNMMVDTLEVTLRVKN